MKRLIGGVLTILLLASGLTSIATASTNDFTFKSFHADYYLGADKEGRSTLKTVETLVAEFPDYDQNHGIERAIPKSYDGHSTGLKIISVANQFGQRLNYTTYDDGNDNNVVRIGDADKYVQGEQTYVITYTRRDVTKYFANVPDDEFYWDTNGTQWSQPFGEVSVTVYTDKNISPTQSKTASCYQGAEGSSTKCTATTQDGVVNASDSNFGVGENMTIAVGLRQGRSVAINRRYGKRSLVFGCCRLSLQHWLGWSPVFGF